MAHLLLAIEHQPDFVRLERILKDSTGPGVTECGIFDLKYGIQIRLGHRAEADRVTHSTLFQRAISWRMAFQTSALRCGSSINSSRPGKAQATPRPPSSRVW
ncbi:hypothetical protein D3C75_1220970 [compost metagenome]